MKNSLIEIYIAMLMLTGLVKLNLEQATLFTSATRLSFWSSKFQTSVALSSTEVEYIHLAFATRDVLWCRNLLGELGFPKTKPSIVYQDNSSRIKITRSYKQHPEIDIKHYFVRDRIKQNEIALEKQSTVDMVADIFTKQCQAPTHDLFS